MARQKTLKQEHSLVLQYIVLTIVSLVALFPFVWSFLAATRDTGHILQSSQAFVLGDHLVENYKSFMSTNNLWVGLWNSILISGVVTILICIVDAMAGFAFSKYQWKGRDAIFFICVCSMFIPSQVTLVPLFDQLSKMGLISTPWAVILPALAGIFGVFLMRQNFMAFPNDLLEAARIDGAGDFRTFITIVCPTMKPAFASLGILTFVQQWGNYLWPLIALNEPNSQTLPLMIALINAGGNIIDYGAIMLGAVVALLPVLIFFLCFQKNFIEGMLSGAVKG
ncbi:MAG: carbohydrate ABC transporter permease [Massiliimalia sp.]|jgi:lactose/L-arabinose transport system permease protein